MLLDGGTPLKFQSSLGRRLPFGLNEGIRIALVQSSIFMNATKGLSLLFLGIFALASLGQSAVTVLRTPDGGIQPQAAVDEKGRAHLIYFKGDPKSGDLLYARFEEGDKF